MRREYEPYNKTEHSESAMSDIVHPRYEELYGKLDEDLRVVEEPVYLSELTIHNDGLIMQFVTPCPNKWWRFWHYVLLGWKWKEL